MDDSIESVRGASDGPVDVVGDDVTDGIQVEAVYELALRISQQYEMIHRENQTEATNLLLSDIIQSLEHLEQTVHTRDDLVQQNLELRTQLEKQKLDHNRLANNCKTLEQFIDEMEQSEESMKNEIRDMIKEMNALREDNDKLRELISEDTQEISGEYREDDLTTTVRELKKQLVVRDTEIHSQIEVIEGLETELAEVEQAVADMRTNYLRAEDEKYELQEQNSRLLEKVKTMTPLTPDSPMDSSVEMHPIPPRGKQNSTLGVDNFRVERRTTMCSDGSKLDECILPNSKRVYRKHTMSGVHGETRVSYQPVKGEESRGESEAVAETEDRMRRRSQWYQVSGIAQGKVSPDQERPKTPLIADGALSKPNSEGLIVIDPRDPDRPRYTKAEFSQVLKERNDAKIQKSLMEDELNSLREQLEALEAEKASRTVPAATKGEDSAIRKMFGARKKGPENRRLSSDPQKRPTRRGSSQKNPDPTISINSVPRSEVF